MKSQICIGIVIECLPGHVQFVIARDESVGGVATTQQALMPPYIGAELFLKESGMSSRRCLPTKVE